MAGVLLRQGALRPQAGSSRRKLSTGFNEELPVVQAQIRQQPQQQTKVKKAQDLLKQKEEDLVEQIKQNDTLQSPPDDWLEPKIYKGSTSF
jgi:hypothetical protein